MLFSTIAASTLALAASFVSASPTAQKRDPIVFSTSPSSFVTCTPTNLTWTGGRAPYYMAIYDAQAGGMWVETTQNTTTVQWTSTAASGKQVNVQIYDADGTPASVNNIPAIGGDDASCVACPTFMGEQAC